MRVCTVTERRTVGGLVLVMTHFPRHDGSAAEPLLTRSFRSCASNRHEQSGARMCLPRMRHRILVGSRRRTLAIRGGLPTFAILCCPYLDNLASTVLKDKTQEHAITSISFDALLRLLPFAGTGTQSRELRDAE